MVTVTSSTCIASVYDGDCTWSRLEVHINAHHVSRRNELQLDLLCGSISSAMASDILEVFGRNYSARMAASRLVLRACDCKLLLLCNTRSLADPSRAVSACIPQSQNVARNAFPLGKSRSAILGYRPRRMLIEFVASTRLRLVLLFVNTLAAHSD